MELYLKAAEKKFSINRLYLTNKNACLEEPQCVKLARNFVNFLKTLKILNSLALITR